MRIISAILIFLFGTGTVVAQPSPRIKVLAFSQVEPGIYHHLSNLDGIALIEQIGKKRGWQVDVTHDRGSFNEKRLAQYDVVAFINTTGNILNAEQQTAFENYIKSGGGFVGTHSAADTEHDWKWYGELVGAYFVSHPEVNQVANVTKENPGHPANAALGTVMPVMEEWYNYTENVRGKPGFTVLLSIDEKSYKGGTMGDDHPIAWAHVFDGGRAFYTGLGHTFPPDHPFMADHLAGGIEWAAGK
ncbi:MAG: ThuA domain-containing protein [Emcibacteraceae bacterium]